MDTGLFEQQMKKQKEKIEAAYESYNESVVSPMECTSYRAVNTLPRFQRLRESNPGAETKDSAKRTESQERTHSLDLKSAGTTRAAPIRGVNLTRKIRSRCSAIVIFSDSSLPIGSRTAGEHANLDLCDSVPPFAFYFWLSACLPGSPYTPAMPW